MIVCAVPSVGAKCDREIVVMMLEMKNKELLLLMGNKDELYWAFLVHLRSYKEMYNDYS